MAARLHSFAIGLILLLAAGTLRAEVTAEEAAALGSTLTPIGAERSGNASGTIPAWTGGITVPPPGYKPGDRHRDPYPDDALLFTITAANALGSPLLQNRANSLSTDAMRVL